MSMVTTEPVGQTLPAKQENGGAVVQRKFDPLAPVWDANSLKGLMESQKRGLSEMLPKHITPERLFKTMLVAANRNPDIFQCTQMSIIETINRAAELGLDLSGTLGEAYPVPFNNKVKTENGSEVWVKQCQLIIGYRGMEKLAWQSGEVESIDAEVVYVNDKFVFRKGTEVFVSWEPCLTADRGAAIGAYACVKMKSGGKLARFLTTADIEKIRASSKSGNSPAWRNWWEEMSRKCALKRTLKDAPLSTEKYVKAMETEAEDYLTDVLRAETQAASRPAGSKTQALAAKVTSRPLSEGHALEPTPEALEEAAQDPASATQTPDTANPVEVTTETPGDAGVAGQADTVTIPIPVPQPKQGYALDHTKWVDAMMEAAMTLNVAESAIQAWMVARFGSEIFTKKSAQGAVKPGERAKAFIDFVVENGGIAT